MEVAYMYKNLSDTEEKTFRDYMDTKVAGISRLLTKFADDAKMLKVSGQKFEKHSAYEIELRLSLPSKVLIAKETKHSINESVDSAKDHLLRQLKDHIAHLQHKRSHASIRG